MLININLKMDVNMTSFETMCLHFLPPLCSFL